MSSFNSVFLLSIPISLRVCVYDSYLCHAEGYDQCLHPSPSHQSGHKTPKYFLRERETDRERLMQDKKLHAIVPAYQYQRKGRKPSHLVLPIALCQHHQHKLTTGNTSQTYHTHPSLVGHYERHLCFHGSIANEPTSFERVLVDKMTLAIAHLQIAMATSETL